MVASRRIDDLDPVVQRAARRWLAACEAEGLDVLVTSTFRDFESQAALYAQGRTAPGRIVTNAGPGQSEHNWRRALDFVPLRAGKPVWGTKGADLELWQRIAFLAKAAGFEWGGDWSKFRDFPHLQITRGRPAWRELLASHPRGLPA